VIDVAIRADINAVQKEVEEKLRYESLCTEIQRMWNLQCKIIPGVTGATGIPRTGLRRILEAIPRKLFSRFSTRDSCTWNITRNTGSTAV
jgi:hypothetical protein